MAKLVTQLIRNAITLLMGLLPKGRIHSGPTIGQPGSIWSAVLEVFAPIKAVGTSRNIAAQHNHGSTAAVAWGPRQTDPTAHMSRLAAIIHALAARCQFAEDCQTRAAQQIDAALYDIERLRADLEASIGLTLTVAGLLPAASRSMLQPVAASGVARPRPARLMVGQAARAQSAA
jgi:hypothetical protein